MATLSTQQVEVSYSSFSGEKAEEMEMRETDHGLVLVAPYSSALAAGKVETVKIDGRKCEVYRVGRMFRDRSRMRLVYIYVTYPTD